MKKKWISMFLLGMMSLTLLTGCGGDKEAENTANAPQTEQKETWTLAVNATFPPFESVKESNGTAEYEGIDIDIAHYIAEKMNVNLEIKDMNFQSLVPSLEAGQTDFILSGISPTEERMKSCDFTNSYFYPQTAIICAKGAGLDTLEKLEGKKIGGSMGTTYVNQAKEIEGAVVSEYDNTPMVIQEIINGRIDAGLFDSSQAVEFVKMNEDKLEMAIIPVELKYEDSYAIALPKGSDKVDEFNAILAEMEENGAMDDILTKWLGADNVAAYKENVAAQKAELEAQKEAQLEKMSAAVE